MKDTGHAFKGLENFLREIFLPCLLFGISKSLPPIVGTLSTMRVNKSGLGLQDPVKLANKKYPSFLRAICNLIGSVKGYRDFSTADHLLVLREERRDNQKIRYDANWSKLKGLVRYLEVLDHRIIICAKNLGYWMTVWGTILTGIVIVAIEFCNFFRAL